MHRSTDHIGVRIRTAREATCRTRLALALEVGVTPSTIQRWESGDGSIKTDSLLTLARILDVDPTWLLVGAHEQAS